MAWNGPNLPAGTTSVLSLQNINKNRAGGYQCTASNDVSSKTYVVANAVVQCKYVLDTYYYLTLIIYSIESYGLTHYIQPIIIRCNHCAIYVGNTRRSFLGNYFVTS
jgi:hypothetical protein